MKICCDQQQICYHRCNSTKIECDNGFQKCLHDQCIEISHDNKQVVGKDENLINFSNRQIDS